MVLGQQLDDILTVDHRTERVSIAPFEASVSPHTGLTLDAGRVGHRSFFSTSFELVTQFRVFRLQLGKALT